MAYRFKIDKDVNCIFVQHFDSFENGEDMAQLKELLQHPDFQPNLNLLRDLSAVAFPEHYNLDTFRENVNNSMPRSDGALGTGRSVAWVLSTANDFKIIHQWAAISRLNVKVVERHPFRDVSAAKKWLKIPESYEIVY